MTVKIIQFRSQWSNWKIKISEDPKWKIKYGKDQLIDIFATGTFKIREGLKKSKGEVVIKICQSWVIFSKKIQLM